MKKTKTAKDDNHIIMDMPEVKDIPGQENVKPPRIKEMEDSTASSSDEEGEGILDDLNEDNYDDGVAEDELLGDEDIETKASSDVTEDEIADLDQTDQTVTEETRDLRKLALDNKDAEDEDLNEEGDPLDMGGDLDVPGSELDDDNEDLGEEDEENNSYSSRD